MPRAPPPGFYVIALVTIFIWFVIWSRDHDRSVDALSYADKFNFNKPYGTGGDNIEGGAVGVADLSSSSSTTTTEDGNNIGVGGATAKKLNNETLKAELGRAAWKLFHTTMAQFPDKPSKDESQALKDYIRLFARLYPCGECAVHFQQILQKYPPQTSSRSVAAAWACFVHNEVNTSKGKPLFDCANIGDWYDCGCVDDEKDGKKDKTKTQSNDGKGVKVEEDIDNEDDADAEKD